MPLERKPVVTGLGPQLQGSGRSGRWGRCFTRAEQRGSSRGAAEGGGGTRSPPARRSRLPHSSPPLSREGPAHASESSGRRVRLDGAKSGGKETPSLARADQLIPDGGTARNPAVVHCAPGKRNSDTRGDTLLSGRFVGSNFPVQTGIYKLLCIDYIYPDPLSPPRPAARVPPAATAPPRPGLGVASGSSYTSRGKCQ